MVEEKKYTIGNKNIDICLLTDLHFDIIYDLSILDKILENVRMNKPDFICLSGDIIDNSNLIYEDLSKLKDFIKDLSIIGQVIITLGNHDISYKENHKSKEGNFDDVNNWFMELQKMENVYYLNNKSLIRGDICFTGYNSNFEYYKKENVEFFIKDIDEKISMTRKYYNVLLCHSPINVFKNITLENSNQIKKADLILSGHMHNGMVLKMFDKGGTVGLISPHKNIFPKCARNRLVKKIDNHEINLIISGGIVKISRVNSKILSKFNKIFPISVVYVKI